MSTQNMFSWRNKNIYLELSTYTITPDEVFFDQKVLLIFLSSQKHICCRYSLEVHQRGHSNEYPQHLFPWENKKNIYHHLSGAL